MTVVPGSTIYSHYAHAIRGPVVDAMSVVVTGVMQLAAPAIWTWRPGGRAGGYEVRLRTPVPESLKVR